MFWVCAGAPPPIQYHCELLDPKYKHHIITRWGGGRRAAWSRLATFEFVSFLVWIAVRSAKTCARLALLGPAGMTKLGEFTEAVVASIFQSSSAKHRMSKSVWAESAILPTLSLSIPCSCVPTGHDRDDGYPSMDINQWLLTYAPLDTDACPQIPVDLHVYQNQGNQRYQLLQRRLSATACASAICRAARTLARRC